MPPFISDATLNSYFDVNSEKFQDVTNGKGRFSANMVNPPYAGLQYMAALMLLREHGFRMSFEDVMNPDRFQKEKREIGQRLLEAMEIGVGLNIYSDMIPVMVDALEGFNELHPDRDAASMAGDPSAEAFRGASMEIYEFAKNAAASLQDVIHECTLNPVSLRAEYKENRELDMDALADERVKRSLAEKLSWYDATDKVVYDETELADEIGKEIYNEVRVRTGNTARQLFLDYLNTPAETLADRNTANYWKEGAREAEREISRQEYAFRNADFFEADLFVPKEDGTGYTVAMTDHVPDARALYGDDLDGAVRALQASSGIQSLDRESTRNHLAIMQMMIMGYSFGEIYGNTPERKNARAEAGTALIRMLSENSVNTLDGAINYASWAKNAGDRLMDYAIPDIDFLDPRQMEAYAAEFAGRASLYHDFIQVVQPLKNREHFRIKFLGGNGTWESTWEQGYYNALDSAAVLLESAAGIYDRSLPMEHRVACRLIMDQYGARMRGKTVQEINRAFSSLNLQTERTEMIQNIAQYGSTLAPEARADFEKAMDDYLAGVGPCPVPAGELNKGMVLPGASVTGPHPIPDQPQSIKSVLPANYRDSLYITNPGDWNKQEVKDESLKAYDQMFGSLNRELECFTLSEESRDAGLASPSQLFYIDGKQIDTYLEEKNVPVNEENRRLHIMRAALEAREHLDVAMIGIKGGRPTPYVRSIQTYLEAFRGKEGIFERSRPSRAARLAAEQSDQAGRVGEIERDLADRIVAGAQKKLNKPLYTKEETLKYRLSSDTCLHSFTGLHRKFMEGEDVALSLHALPKEDRASAKRYAKLKDIKDGNKSLYATEMFRGNAGGLTAMAALLLMSEHPEVHFTDLTDPSKYANQKREAGNRLMEAMEQVYEHPEKLGQIIAACAKTMSRLDYRKETLYALGVPHDQLDMPNDQAEAILTDPKNRVEATEALAGLAGFVRGAHQVIQKPFSILGAVEFYNGAIAPKAGNCPDIVRQVYMEVQRHMTADDRKRYCDLYTKGMKPDSLTVSASQAAIAYENTETMLQRNPGDVIAQSAKTEFDLRVLAHFGNPANVPDDVLKMAQQVLANARELAEDMKSDMNRLRNEGHKVVYNIILPEEIQLNISANMQYVREEAVRIACEVLTNVDQRTSETPVSVPVTDTPAGDAPERPGRKLGFDGLADKLPPSERPARTRRNSLPPSKTGPDLGMEEKPPVKTSKEHQPGPRR